MALFNVAVLLFLLVLPACQSGKLESSRKCADSLETRVGGQERHICVSRHKKITDAAMDVSYTAVLNEKLATCKNTDCLAKTENYQSSLLVNDFVSCWVKEHYYQKFSSWDSFDNAQNYTICSVEFQEKKPCPFDDKRTKKTTWYTDGQRLKLIVGKAVKKARTRTCECFDGQWLKFSSKSETLGKPCKVVNSTRILSTRAQNPQDFPEGSEFRTVFRQKYADQMNNQGYGDKQ